MAPPSPQLAPAGQAVKPVTHDDDLGDDDTNPLERNPRWMLTAQANVIRSAMAIGISLGNMCSPAAPAPTKVVWLDATLGQCKAKRAIRVDVWEPRQQQKDKRPAVIVFHGGGFVLGQGTDDSRWAAACVSGLGAVMLAVGYRLAPGYPFPTPVEDCASAVAQICSPAFLESHRLDGDRVVVSGFSAGGTLALASWVALQAAQAWGYDDDAAAPPRVAGLVLFYPMLDYTVGRPHKRRMSVRPDLTLPRSLTDLFDASYVFPPRPRSERGDLRLSPGLMPDPLLRRLPPLHLCLCEYDMLLAEGLVFADRIRIKGGGRVEVRIVRGEKHAWDKPPPLAPKESVGREYAAAVSSIRGWLGRGAEMGGGEGEGGDMVVGAVTGTTPVAEGLPSASVSS